MDSSSAESSGDSTIESVDDSIIESSAYEMTKEDLELSETDDDGNSASSDDQKNSGNSSSDEEEPIAFGKKKKIKRILDSENESSDDEEKERKSFYEKNPEGDLSLIVEDQTYSKATRRSIFGFQPKRESLVKNEPISEEDDSSDDSDIILCDSESEPENELENFDNSGIIEKKMSSTVRSPFKEIDKNVETETSKEYKRVSKTYFETQQAELDGLNIRYNSLQKIEFKGMLPDGGEKLRIAMEKLKADIHEKENVIKKLIVDDEESIKNQIVDSFKSDGEHSIKDLSKSDNSEINFLAAEDVQPKYTGKVGMKNFEQQKALTVEKLQDIHRSLDQRPADDAVTEPPKYLRIELMHHQLHALAFMQWRETQKPRGGILADDMGLGKTLTVISLILKQLQADEEKEDDYESESDEGEREAEDEWIARGHKSLKDGGTLVVCPASLINQWEEEIKSKVKRNALSINVFHGAKRTYKAKELVRYDVVITTYQIILSEYKNNGCLFGVKWDRIVLDEGHVIRNYRSKQSEAVCSLFAKKRWVLSGTPIQNKEFDLYASVKFLHCSPFDDLRYWRMWIETKKGGSSPRLQALLKSILLRRTKVQLQESGAIEKLPDKIYEQFSVALNNEERNIYNRMMALSQQVFAQFLAQQQEKHNNYTYDTQRLHKLHQRFAKTLNVHREVQSHEILTLLLRLRQICCHPGLVKEAIERSELVHDEIDQENNKNDPMNDSDMDILSKLHNLKLNDEEEQASVVPISTQNEVFNMDIPSSKVEKLMEIIRERLTDSDEKAIIVSQWVSYLNIVRGMLEIEDIGYCELNGTIPVKNRNDIVVDFNNPRSSKKVMLLSITAGGVGLNLVGANMLFIMDPHWNPQIEQQAQDRIYRFGQTKNVKIYKFICADTIEEKILLKQQEKLELATSALTGAKRSATKLTIEDLKDLFGMK